MKRERRTIKAAELRISTDGDNKYLEGYAARYNVLSHDLGFGIKERLIPGAFKRAMNEKQDVRHLINHDPSLVLGRTAAGTTVLNEDVRGLHFRTQLPNTQYARDLAASVERGDIDECSFGFIPKKTRTATETDDVTGEVVDVREVMDVDLMDVSTVTFPAYPDTNTKVAMRAMFPDGIPADLRDKIEGDFEDGEERCMCRCAACQDDRCEECSADDCEDENCYHGYDGERADTGADDFGEDNEGDGSAPKPAPFQQGTQKSSRRDTPKTKKVDGANLTHDKFLIVGDVNDPSTWHLPVDFPNEDQTKKHIRNALARFDQVKGVSEDVMKSAWRRLVALAEKHGIKVSDADKKKHGARAMDSNFMLAARLRLIELQD